MRKHGSTGHQVYVLRSKDDDRDYIGVTERPWHRWNQHNSAATNGKVGELYDAMRKYGASAFSFEVVGIYQDRHSAEKHERALIKAAFASGRAPYNKQKYPACIEDFRGDMSVPQRLALAQAVISEGLVKWCSENDSTASDCSRFLNGKRSQIPTRAALALGISVNKKEEQRV